MCILVYVQTPGVAATWQTCFSEVCRTNFAEVGNLENREDITTSLGANETAVMAFALDMGNITQSENPLVFAMGLFRNESIWYAPNGASLKGSSQSKWMGQKPLWQRRWGDIPDAVGAYSCTLVPVGTHPEWRSAAPFWNSLKRSLALLPSTPKSSLMSMHCPLSLVYRPLSSPI
jgi:hypothetical protein